MENSNKLGIYLIGVAVVVLLTYGQIYLVSRIMGNKFSDTVTELGVVGVVLISTVSLGVSIFFVIIVGSYF
jgi:hypothetical protein